MAAKTPQTGHSEKQGMALLPLPSRTNGHNPAWHMASGKSCYFVFDIESEVMCSIS